MEAKVVNTSLLGYQSAAREEDRESEGEREADFPRAQCKVGINSAIARAAPPLKHREGRSVRGQRSEAGEGAQERRDGGRRWWCKGMGVVVVVVWVSQCSTATCVRLKQGCARLSGESGVDGEVVEGRGWGVSRALRGAVLPRSARVAQ